MILMGVFGVCVVDMLGLLKYKYNEMFVCSVIGFLVVFVIGFVILNIFVLWFMIVLFMFVLLLIVVYGNCWLQISFVMLFMMVMMFEEKFMLLQVFVNVGWIFVGGFWYMYWVMFVL